MRQRTLQLFQLFLLVFAFYAQFRGINNPRLLVALACLITVFVVGKLDSSLAKDSRQEDRQGNKISKKDETKITVQSLNWLLKSKNVQLLTDAIQYLLKDLGLVVSACPEHPAIDRLVRIPGMQLTLGLKVLSDVSALNESLDQWEELGNFDLGKGGRRRLLIIGSNGIKAEGASEQRYKNFSVDSQALLSARQVVGMTTLTLSKIYLACKKKKVDIKTIFYPIQHHPGGVFQLEGFAQ